MDDTSAVRRSLRLRATSQPKVKTEAVSQATKSEKKRIFNSDFIAAERALIEADFPKFLWHTGNRLCTFAKLVAKFSNLLVNDFGFSEEIIVTFFFNFA